MERFARKKSDDAREHRRRVGRVAIVDQFQDLEVTLNALIRGKTYDMLHMPNEWREIEQLQYDESTSQAEITRKILVRNNDLFESDTF